jgi:hypothetical protein
MVRTALTTLASTLAPLALTTAAGLAIGGCHDPGPYGHTRIYAPTNAEQGAVKGAREYDPVMVRRFPDEWHRATVTVFGVVLGRGVGPSGHAMLTLSVRRLEPRNLCRVAEEEASCRVTVSDTEFAILHALVPLVGEDDESDHAVRPGSLVRLVGKLGEDADPADGMPILRATFYRHWPNGAYVTRADAAELRQ